MKIGFLGTGHLAKHAEMAAVKKGFQTTSIRFCDIVYIAPDRPSEEAPQVLVDYALKEMREDAILVIHCQVEPGFTRRIKWPQVYYHVETLKVNDEALERALNPERIIVGCSMDGKTFLSPIWQKFLIAFNCPILTMSYESAELTKIALNIYLASQLCTTNTLSEIAEKIGANWNDIIPALQTDKRIGKDAYLKPGNGVGKHIMRDLEMISKMGGNVDVIKSFIEHARYRNTL